MKLPKYLIGIALAIVVLYNSVYFRKLDEYRATSQLQEFNPAGYAREFWDSKLLPNLDQAVELKALIDLLSQDEAKAFDTYSHALGIGNLRYFLVSGRGTVKTVGDDGLTLELEGAKPEQRLVIATEFIFGNAVRDATGLINVDEFVNTMDFNNVSAEINAIIRKEVLPGLKSAVAPGDVVEFTGAIELNRERYDLNAIEVVPVRATVRRSTRETS